MNHDGKENNIVVLSFILLLVPYYLSSFLKISASVTMPYFQETLGLSSTTVGIVSSMFFLAYAVMQVLGGELCLRHGSLKVMTAGLVLSALGTMCFAIASSPALIIVGRFLMGVGIGPAFVSVVTLLQENYTGKKYSELAGFSVMICQFGAACSSAPLQYFINRFDISSLFIGLTAFQILFAFLLFVASGKYKNHVAETDGIGFWAQLRLVFKMLLKSRILVACFIVWVGYNAVLATYQGLWAVKWTAFAFNANKVISSYSVSVSALGIMIGCVICEKIRMKKLDRTSELSVHILLQIIIFCVLVAIKFLSDSFVYTSIVIDGIYGLSIGLICVQISAIVRENSDASHNAIIMGFLNGTANVGSLVLQSLSGVLVDFFVLRTEQGNAFGLSFIIIGTIYLASLYAGRHILKQKICR